MHTPPDDSELPTGQGGKAATVAETALGPPSSWPAQPAEVGKKPVGQKQSCAERAEPVEDCPGTGHSAHAPPLLKEPRGHAPIFASGTLP